MTTTATISKTLEIPARVRNQLVQWAVWGHVYGATARVSARELHADGRARNGLWKKLIAHGYVKIDKTTADEGRPLGYATSKAFDEQPVELVGPLDPAEFFRYDSDSNRHGHRVWVAFDALPLPYQVVVVKRLLLDPTSARLLAVFDLNGRYSDHKPYAEPFALGGASAAQHAAATQAGRPQRSYDAQLVVTTASIEAKYALEAGKRASQMAMTSGLDWFLQSTGVMAEGESVPVHSKSHPSLGFSPQLAESPVEWSVSLPATIEATRREIASAEVRLERLLKFQKAVEDAGGYDAFTVDYSQAITKYLGDNPPDAPTY